MNEILEQVGLSPTEVKVYLALLDGGESTASQILKKAKLNSGRIYDVLGSLEEKGFISSIIKRGTKRFNASPPECVHQYLERKANSIVETRQEFNRILPLLTKRFESSKDDVRVEVFFGVDGFRNSYELLFSQSKNDKNLYVYGVSSQERYPKSLLNTMQYYTYKERKERKLTVRKIAAEEIRDDPFFKQDKSEIRYLPYPTVIGIEVLGSVTRISYEKEPFIIINIESKKISEEFRRNCKFLWSVAIP